MISSNKEKFDREQNGQWVECEKKSITGVNKERIFSLFQIYFPYIEQKVLLIIVHMIQYVTQSTPLLKRLHH